MTEQNPFGEPIDRDFLDYVETSTDFWNRKPQLQLIAEIAAREEISPWGLLLSTQIHQLSNVEPTVVLVKRSGSKGTILSDGTSLNMFGALTAPTGGGKSATFREANGLVVPRMHPIADGTGQGIVKAFAETEKVTHDEDKKRLDDPYYVTRYFTHSVVVHAPEINTLNAEFMREGSKTASMMRSLWVGEIVGSTTGDITRRVTLIPNTYRIGGLWGVQPVNAAGLLAGADDGTPQRWVWAPAEEFRVGSRTHPARTPAPSNTRFPLPQFNPNTSLFGPSGGELPQTIDKNTQLPAPIWVEWSPKMYADITSLRADQQRAKDRDPYAPITPEQRDLLHRVTMESHMVLSRIKMAAALGFLWGHASPDDEDWDLSEAQMEVSRRELAGAWLRANEAKYDALTDKGTQRGVEMYAANVERDTRQHDDDRKLADEVWKILAKQPLTTTALKSKMSSSKRGRLSSVLDILEEQHRYVLASNGLHWAVRDGMVLPAEMMNQFR